MHMIGRDNRHGFDPVGPLGFRLRHALEIVVDAILGKADRLPGATRFFGRRRQGAGDELIVIVDPGRYAMNGADEGAFAAADHAEPDPIARLSVVASLYRHLPLPQRSPSARLICFLSTAAPAKSSKAFSVTRII